MIDNTPSAEEQAKQKAENAVNEASQILNKHQSGITGLVADNSAFHASNDKNGINVSDGGGNGSKNRNGNGGSNGHGGNGSSASGGNGPQVNDGNGGPSHIVPVNIVRNNGNSSGGGIGQGTPNMQGGLLQSKNGKQGPNGTYNSIRDIDLSDLDEATARGTLSGLRESDAYQGYSKMRRYTALMGMGTATKHAEQQDIWNGMKIHDKNKEADLRQALGENVQRDAAGNYINMGTGSNAYQVNGGRKQWMNGLHVYDENIRKIDNALEKHGINGKNLNNTEIRNGLRTGRLGKKKLTKEEMDLLQEKLRLNHYRNKYRNARSRKTGIRNTVNAYAQETMGESEVVQGYNMVKTGWQVGGVVRRTARGAAAVGVDVGVFTAKNGAMLNNRIKSMKANVKYQKALQSGNVTDIANKKQVVTNLQNQRANIRSKTSDIYGKVNNWNQRGTDGIIRDKIKEKLGNTKLGRTITNTRDNIRDHFVKRYEAFTKTKRGTIFDTVVNGRAGLRNLFHAPGKFLSKLNTAKRLLLVGLGAIFIFCFVVNAITIALCRVLNTASASDAALDHKSAGINSSWNPLQETQNDLQVYLDTFNAWASDKASSYQHPVPAGEDEDGNPIYVMEPYSYEGIHYLGASDSSLHFDSAYNALPTVTTAEKSKTRYRNNNVPSSYPENVKFVDYDESVLLRSILCAAVGFTKNGAEQQQTIYSSYIGSTSYDVYLDEETMIEYRTFSAKGLLGKILDVGNFETQNNTFEYSINNEIHPTTAITEYVDRENFTVSYSINQCGLENIVEFDMTNEKGNTSYEYCVDAKANNIFLYDISKNSSGLGERGQRISDSEAHQMGSTDVYMNSTSAIARKRTGNEYQAWRGWYEGKRDTDSLTLAISLFELNVEDYEAQLGIFDLQNVEAGEEGFTAMPTKMEQQEFINTILPMVYKTMQERGWTNADKAARYALAQMCLEVGYGKSCYNYNLGFLTGNKGHGTFKMGGNPRSFTIYTSYQECINDYLRRLEKMWPGTMTANSLKNYVYALEMTGAVYCGNVRGSYSQYMDYYNKINGIIGHIPEPTAMAEYTGSTTGEGPYTGGQK